MAVGAKSRYNRAALISVVDAVGNATRRPYLDIVPRFRKVAFPDDLQLPVEQVHNWSLIGFKALGDGQLWWLVAEVNKVVDPWRDLAKAKTDGTIFRVPSVPRAQFSLLDFEDGEV